MAIKNLEVPKITSSNTKKEMLDAFKILTEKLTEKAQTELKPEIAQKTMKEKEIVKTADAASKEGIIKRVYDLKDEIGKALTGLAAKMEDEKEHYTKIKEAIAIKNNELKEIFEIETSAFSLAALLEAQKHKKEAFEVEMKMLTANRIYPE